MAEENEDPREVPWHPRHAASVQGQDQAMAHFRIAFAQGRVHHAWLLQGPKGIGKATFAYAMAKEILGGAEQGRRWVEARAHPDLFVLERQLNDAKPRKLKAEISVDDARALGGFMSRTAASGWRVVIVDAADDLNSESANAILKLVEEPPEKAIFFILSHRPGKLLRTIKSRCLRLVLQDLDEGTILNIINTINFEDKPSDEVVAAAISQAKGSVGEALSLMNSIAAKAFGQFVSLRQPKPSQLLGVAGAFVGKGNSWDEVATFHGLLQGHVAAAARTHGNAALAATYQALEQAHARALGFNLDKRQAVMEALTLASNALKAQ